MKKMIIAILLLLNIGAKAQHQYELSFVNSQIEGSKFRVVLKMNANMKSFYLGSTNLRFNFPQNVLANPVLISETFPELSYKQSTLLGTNLKNGIATLNTVSLNNAATEGILIDRQGVELALLEFDIINKKAFTKLKWMLSESFPQSAVVTFESKPLAGLPKEPETIELTPFSLNHNETTASFSCLPNPAHDQVVIEYHSELNGIAEITLSDLNGRIIRTQRNDISIGFNNVEFDLNDVSVGNYFITLTANQSQSSLKLTRE